MDIQILTQGAGKMRVKLMNLNFHDAHLLDMVYSRCDSKITLTTSFFLEPERDAVPLNIEFKGVTFFSCADFQPWGPSQYINIAEEMSTLPYGLGSLKDKEKALRIEMQSGDEIFIIYQEESVEIVGEY